MSVLVLFAIAAAPSIRQQAQREQEKEAIFRGEQVAEAILSYYRYRRSTLGTASDAALATSMDQLLEGIPVPGGTKKRQILRASAARDPLSDSGEWRFIRPRSQALLNFERAIMLYSNNFLPPPSPQVRELQQFAGPPQISAVINTGLNDKPPEDDDALADATGPFVGVTSASERNAVVYYYGIDRHDHWVFTPLFR